MRTERQDANQLKNRLVLPCRFPASFRYIPVSFVDDDTIIGPDLLAVGGVGWYEFGILSSSLHFEWMKAVAGEADGLWQYDPRRVYNNFIWPGPQFDVEMSEERFLPIKAEIESAARAIAAAREAHPDFSFGKHYPDEAMPEDIRAAHAMNDRAVAKAYGFDPDSPTSAVLSRLFVLYTKATEQLKNQPPPRDRESPRWHGGGRPRR